nr:unnamed protein product [Callosobruchus chinensis]
MGKKRSKPKPRPKPVINYPPVPTKKWIPPDQRPKKPKPPPAYVKPEGITQKLRISSLKKVWNQYEIIGKIPTLLGHFSQTHKKYTFKTNGYQGACNCAIACVFAHIYKMKIWTRYYLDQILDLGDNLYVRTITQPSESCLVEVPPEKVFNSFFLRNQKITIVIDEQSRIIDKVSAIAENKVKEVFDGALNRFFRQFPSGIFSMLGKYVAIWVQDDAWYLFDPTEHDDVGDPWKGIPGWGVSALYRCKTMADLVNCLYKNLNTKVPHTKFEIFGCVVQRIVNLDLIPPETFEDIAPLEEKAMTLEDMEDTKEEQLVDVMQERLKEYVEEGNAEVDSLVIKVQEISPFAPVEFEEDQRPSWVGDDSIVKVDVCKFPVPHKVQPERLTYYLELDPGKIGILRASTSQTDPKLSKYLGRQSMGNAISALIMLRFHKSRVWIPKILNSVLRYGDLLYRDAMITIPRTQSLKLSNFQKKTEYEGKNFMPIVEDYVVVGRLQSQDFEVFDLRPALETFLADHECCVIIGPLTLAVWFEDGKYYMFDPNDRDKNGKAIVKSQYVGSVLVPMDYIPGLACVTWFKNLRDLVALYMDNVDKASKTDPFYLSKVEITDYKEVPDAWYSFKGLVPGKWILRGSTSQSNKKYSKRSRDFQSPANCLMAITLQYLTPMKDWGSETVDEEYILLQVLDRGDQLYNETLDYLEQKSIFETKMLMLNEVNTVFKFPNQEAVFVIDECVVNGSLKAGNDLLNLENGLEMFFRDNDRGIVALRNISVAVWRNGGVYYYFDSHDRDDKGLTTGYGTACIVRAILISELAAAIEFNLKASSENLFNIHRINVEFYDSGSGVEQEKREALAAELEALCPSKVEEEGEAQKTSSRTSANQKPSASTASTKPSIAQSEAVSEPQSSEIPTTFEEEEQEATDGVLKLEQMSNELTLGLNKFLFEFEDVFVDTQEEGAKGDNIRDNLKPVLKAIYEQEQTEDYFNQEIILESKPLAVAIWRDDKRFYVFDPMPRDTDGTVIGKEDWSEAEEKPQSVVSVESGEVTDEEAKPIEDEVNPFEEHIELITDADPGAGGDQPGDQGPFVEGLAADIQFPEEQEEENEDGGIKYIKPLRKSSSFWREQEKAGRGCVVLFTKLEDMVEHVYGKIPPKMRQEESFKLKSAKMTNAVLIKNKLRSEEERTDVYAGDWYFFQEIEHGKWIMRGTLTIWHPMFPESNRGKQTLAMCVSALLIYRIFTIVCFNDTTVDSILTYGDKLHTFMKKTRKKELMEMVDKKLKEDEIDWNRGPSGVIAQNGVACIIRTLGVKKLVDTFLANLPKNGSNYFCIHKVTMIKDLCPRHREPKQLAEPKLAVTSGGFQRIMPGKTIVRGTISQEDPKFGKGQYVMSAPIAFIALTMSLVHNASVWSKPIIDDIIELGAELYEESLLTLEYDYNPWEEVMDVHRVNNDYTIGVLKANCELRNTIQKGIIDAKSGQIQNLRQGLERFFEENTHGIIVTDPLVLAIWEEEQDHGAPMIYMYDPNPRGPMGMPLFTGTACLVTFVNVAMAAEHIIACILEPDKRMGEFTIVPVEIVVGNVRTINKCRRAKTRSSINVLPRCSKLHADEEKKALRKIAENDRRRQEARRRQLLGRKCYYTLKGADAIIRGYRSQNSEQYSQESRNNQDIPNCIVCLVLHHLVSVENWNAKHVDLILDIGDQLYIDSYIAYGPIDPKLGMENIMRKFFFKHLEIHVTVYKPIISDIFVPGVLNRVLNVYFQQETFCILSYEDQWVTIIFKSGLFYLFDPHDRDIDGKAPKKDNKEVSAVVFRSNSLVNISDRIIDNFLTGEEEEGQKMFTVWLISVEIQ